MTQTTKWIGLTAGLALAVFSLGLGSCGSDGGSGGGSGTSTIDGNVSSASTAAVEEADRSWLARLRNGFALVGEAIAQGMGLGGIEVEARRGDREVVTETDNTGGFSLPGSPAGSVQVSFRQNGCEASQTVPNVADGSTLTLEDVELDCNAVTGIGKVAESLSGVVENVPSSAAGNLNLCVHIGDGATRTRIVKRQNLSGGDEVAQGDGIEVDGEREGLGENSALDATAIRNLGPESVQENCVIATPTPTPEPSPTPTPEP